MQYRHWSISHILHSNTNCYAILCCTRPRQPRSIDDIVQLCYFINNISYCFLEFEVSVLGFWVEIHEFSRNGRLIDKREWFVDHIMEDDKLDDLVLKVHKFPLLCRNALPVPALMLTFLFDVCLKVLSPYCQCEGRLPGLTPFQPGWCMPEYKKIAQVKITVANSTTD